MKEGVPKGPAGPVCGGFNAPTMCHFKEKSKNKTKTYEEHYALLRSGQKKSPQKWGFSWSLCFIFQALTWQ
ncbi:hypothetical protein AOR01nite_17410 [Acetobacter orleanensis]|uniref:Uncharacterized protein n=1 Tax=Acetobacter orleanensis TaxID=104099 RepID=A0A4Y3TNA6_9PROT|nr:hypothetical protein Abol_020_076 [Acetobacter orleanensis JCM 7639]GEB83264.1 hypothetical protein AOR01nite_17410 [Acetobacter orleanensis]